MGFKLERKNKYNHQKYELIFTKDFLYNEYIIKDKSLRLIAKENNTTKTTITRHLKRNNISIKSPGLPKGKYIRTKAMGYIDGRTLKETKCMICGKKSSYHSKLCWECFLLPENNANYIDGRSIIPHFCLDCGRELLYYNTQRCQLCHLKTIKGGNHPGYKNGRTLKKHYCQDCDTEISWNAKRCEKCYYKFESISRQGKNHPNWIENRSLLEYPDEFNKILKNKIRKRDNGKCQNCGKTQEQELLEILKKLSIHHIDYNKQNCKRDNLITLCRDCNLSANSNRDYWYAYYTYKLGENNE